MQDTVGQAPLRDLGRILSGQQPTFMDGSLLMFLPELVVAGTILALLFVRLLSVERWFSGKSIALFGATLGLVVSAVQYMALKNFAPAGEEVFSRVEFFTGLLVYDAFTLFFRVFLFLFLVLVIYLTRISGIPDEEDAPDFYTLLLGSTLGMLLMVAANHLLIVFLGVEMTSVPSYAMVGFLKGRKTSSEAAFKYVVYGAGAAGVMLYGLSLVGGLLGTLSFPALAQRAGEVLALQDGLVLDPTLVTLLLGIVMVLVGLAFKLSIFPFHFWAPDAFEGAAAEIGAFLSIASKGAAFALLLRFCLALVGVNGEVVPKLAPVLLYLGVGMGAVAAVTVTFGNLAAYSQTNIKRMLAYSTIAHAGYMLMGVAAVMVVLNATSQQEDPQVRWEQAIRCIEGLLYYLWVYMFMNLGAFAIVAAVRNEIFSEEISDYAGMAQHSPLVAASAVICLFSLVGLPPFGGFVGKFMVFFGVYQAAQYHWAMWLVLVLGCLNTVFSLFYYLRVLKIMYINQPAPDARRIAIPGGSAMGVFIATMATFVLLTGIIVSPLSQAAHDVAAVLFP